MNLEEKTKDLIVLYEDNHIIVVVKEENILSQADNTLDLDMLTLVKNYIKEKHNKPGNVYLGLVSRLDRRVGGVMVFAKSSKAASRLSDDIRTHNINKEYYAIVEGIIDTDGSLKDYLYKDEKELKAIISSENNKEAKEAILNYYVQKKIEIDNSNYTLLKIELITGRYNQIRAQLSHFNHPIINDFKYGYKGKNYEDSLGLWCHQISFTHPVTKEDMTFSYTNKSGVWRYI